MRISVLAVLVFFLLAPTALAVDPSVTCTDNGGRVLCGAEYINGYVCTSSAKLYMTQTGSCIVMTNGCVCVNMQSAPPAKVSACGLLNEGAMCDAPDGSAGKCVNKICVSNAYGEATCALYGKNAACVNAGVTGTCTSSSVCQPNAPATGSGSLGSPQTPSPSSGSLGQPSNTNNSGQNVSLLNPLKGGTLESFLENILAFVIRIGAIIVVLMLVYVGFLFVKAQGEPGKITEARQALLWTVVGALILLGAQAIAYGIEATVKALSIGK